MTRWQISYCPEEGERESPYDFILNQEPKVQSQLFARLTALSALDRFEWPRGWHIKPVGETLQMTVGDFRIYFIIDENRYLIVCHICRKKGQKANKLDIQRADSNAAMYFDEKGRVR